MIALTNPGFTGDTRKHFQPVSPFQIKVLHNEIIFISRIHLLQ